MKKELVLTLESVKTPFQSVVEWLGTSGYTRVAMVMEPGDFAVRGSIVDVFPANHDQPVRIDFFGGQIDRLASFHLQTQRSLSRLTTTRISPFTGSQASTFATELSEASSEVLSMIEAGDVIVHEDYGIGIFRGLKRLCIGGREGEYGFIEYAGTDRLYLPLEKMGALHKYTAGESDPKLSSLGDGSWNRTKTRVQKAAEEFVESVYRLHQLRQEQQGFACQEDSELQLELEQSFPYPDTRDQQRASAEIKRDMELPHPMDRLLCGDVGYGKTEVIVRAVFKAIDNGKQAAVLVPTTLLAQQHYHTFTKRFAEFGISTAVLSRFQSRSEQKRIADQLKSGRLLLVIGTHRLLSKDIYFKDLGLLVIDEEQRFGVRHKEHLKQFRQMVDVLSVSATPIPRTLYMSLTGARELSMIETPPKSKHPIITTVAAYNEVLAADAIAKELARGGQVYYLINRVAQIPKVVAKLSRLMPQSRVGVAHGQMAESQLERVMLAFLDRKIDILVCTAIIESGLDIRNVNTIIIDEVQLLGLSQLHQLRGRVGRGDRQAYAVLLYPEHSQLTEKAERRLQAVKEYSALGSGYHLAMKDLEIRGAGALLGHKQHGYMVSVGFDLYCQLLLEASRKRFGKPVNLRRQVVLDRKLKAYIPETYIPAERERLMVYQQLMLAKDPGRIDALIDEMEDRYGLMPSHVFDLFQAIKLEL